MKSLQNEYLLIVHECIPLKGQVGTWVTPTPRDFGMHMSKRDDILVGLGSLPGSRPINQDFQPSLSTIFTNTAFNHSIGQQGLEIMLCNNVVCSGVLDTEVKYV